MNHFLVIEDKKLDTGKNYRHNFQGMNFESENCIFYIWHKKEIKLIESKNLGSTMTAFYVKDSMLKIESKNENFKQGMINACQIFSAFDEDNGGTYNFLPYFQTKLIDRKNQIFEKLGLKISLKNSLKGILVENNELKENGNTEDLNIEGKFGFLFGLILLYGKFEVKGDKLSAIKIQLPLFGQYLTTGNIIRNIQKDLQNNGIFIQISENIQGDKHMYEITSNDYELLNIFANNYIPVENFAQITKREQAQEAIESLKKFLEKEGKKETAEKINNSCVKLLQKI